MPPRAAVYGEAHLSLLKLILTSSETARGPLPESLVREATYMRRALPGLEVSRVQPEPWRGHPVV
jgi:hypothetical protein